MTETPAISARRSSQPARQSDPRYRLTVKDGSCPSVCVQDEERVILRWVGELARRLLSRPTLPERYRKPGTHALSKKHVQCFALAAAALKIQLDTETEADRAAARIDANERLWARLDELGIRIPALHRRIAQQLFSYPGVHFCEQDVVCMLMLEYTSIEPDRLRQIAMDLARWGIVQRIDVNGTAFYDINTRPHLHVYRTNTHELVDAPLSGVIHVS